MITLVWVRWPGHRDPCGCPRPGSGDGLRSQPTIAAGTSAVTKAGVALTAASLVLATLQQNRAGVFVQAAVPNVPGSSFTIHLNKNVSASTDVAWFVVN